MAQSFVEPRVEVNRSCFVSAEETYVHLESLSNLGIAQIDHVFRAVVERHETVACAANAEGRSFGNAPTKHDFGPPDAGERYQRDVGSGLTLKVTFDTVRIDVAHDAILSSDHAGVRLAIVEGGVATKEADCEREGTNEPKEPTYSAHSANSALSALWSAAEL